jgi:hypothetical protein
MDDIRRTDRRTYAVAQKAYKIYDSDPHISMLRDTVWDVLRSSARGEFTAARCSDLLEGLTQAERGYVWSEVTKATRDAADLRENFRK